MQNIRNALTQRGSRGFTLIELLVVIAIIAVLAALVLAALTSAQKGGRDSKRKSDLNQYKTALAQLNADKGAYPVAGLGAMSATATPYHIAADDTADLDGTYMSGFLDDPSSGADYHYIGTAQEFGICAQLEKVSTTSFRVTPTQSGELASVTASSGCTAAD